MNKNNEYSEGWEFFISNEFFLTKLRTDSEPWALGWLAAAADYSEYGSITEAVVGVFGNNPKTLEFIDCCNRAVVAARQRGEFVRLPVKVEDNENFDF